MSRQAPSKLDLLEALAASFEAGASPTEALALIARAGPASARIARLLSDQLRTGTLTVTAALVAVQLLDGKEQLVVALGEETGRLPAALRWALERSRTRSERGRAIRGAVLGPLLFAIISLLCEPLPQMILGTGSLWPSLLRALLLAATAAALLVGLPRLLAGSARSSIGRIPWVRSLVQLDDEASTAALVAVFADANGLALAPRAARTVAPPPHAEALTVAAADPLAALTVFSEPFALALKVGSRAGDLPARLSAFQRDTAGRLTARLRGVAKVLAYAVLLVVALHGISKLLSTSLPGLGGDLGNSPELKQLEEELENAGH